MTPAPREARVSVLAADSHPLYLIGLANTIRESSDLDLIATTTTGFEALALIRAERPQVAALDLRLQGGDARDIIRMLRSEDEPTRVLLICDHATGELVLQCLSAGAAGVLSKHASPDEVRGAILTIGRGESVLPANLGRAVAAALRRRGKDVRLQLTERELQVLRRISQGESSADIAVGLNLGVSTVKTHIQHVYAKLGVNDRAAAVAVGIRHSLIS